MLPPAEVDNVINADEDESMEPHHDTPDNVLARTVRLLDAIERRLQRDGSDMRADLRAFRGETSANFNHVRTDMNGGLSLLRGEMNDRLSQLHGGFNQLHGEMTDGFNQLRGEMNGG